MSVPPVRSRLKLKELSARLSALDPGDVFDGNTGARRCWAAGFIVQTPLTSVSLCTFRPTELKP